MRLTPTLFTLTLYLFSTSSAFSYANIAPTPIKVRQTYSDKTFTEVACPPFLKNRTRVVCEFRVRIGKRTHNYKFSMSDYNYNPYLAIHHTYWPNQGLESFTVAFDVICNEADIRLAKQENGDNINCVIFFFQKEKQFIAGYVQIIGKENDKLIYEERVLNDGY
jgi:hypothetical protein